MLSKRYSIGQLLLVLGIVILAFSAPNDTPWASPVSAEAEATPVSAEVEAVPAAVVPGGPGYVMIPAVAFLPASSSTSYTIFWGDLSVPNGSATGPQSFYAPVFLPQGARRTGMTLFYHDTIIDSNTLGVDLLRKPLPSSSSGESVGLSVYPSLTGFG